MVAQRLLVGIQVILEVDDVGDRPPVAGRLL
jgi:hypothetical protein